MAAAAYIPLTREEMRSHKAPFARPVTDKGFTLLEVLLAIVLLVTGTVFLLQVFTPGLFAGGENETELVAINLAQEKMEEIRNTVYANIASEARAVVAGSPVFEREVVVSVPQTSLKQATVKVYWSAKADELNMTLVTYVSDI